ncbi:hypothetical protein K440DRAFT_584731 [Wilcoxina mikolae CBS 423.85]|nr:hypothetical protein K440DRAFT_584731 [Wilcoxina mikolae CBS 423.85]
MGELQSPTPHDLRVESWTMYSVGVVFILLRLYSRQLVLGSWKRLQIEDYLMAVDLAVYTILMAAINVSGSTATNLYGPGEYETFTPEDIKVRIYGSKVVILLEQAMLLCTYLTKACMLLLYHRLASRLPHQFAIKLISAYSLMGYIATEMAWFLNCRPLSGYWALPVPDPQCATYTHYVIVQGVFNLSSDLMILAVGIPLLMKAKVDTKKKVILVGIFSLGLFVVLAAVLSKYYNFSNPTTTIYMLWYIRESSTAIYVANVPMLWPLVRRIFRAGTFAGSTGSQGYHKGSNGSSGHELSQRMHRGKAKQLDSVLDTEINPSPNGSQERINKKISMQEGRIEIEQRVSFSVEEQRPPADGTFDVEKYGNPRYKAHVSGGVGPGTITTI